VSLAPTRSPNTASCWWQGGHTVTRKLCHERTEDFLKRCSANGRCTAEKYEEPRGDGAGEAFAIGRSLQASVFFPQPRKRALVAPPTGRERPCPLQAIRLGTPSPTAEAALGLLSVILSA